MYEYRITKYDPINRNEFGHYALTEEWTDFSDVGNSVSLEEYERMEMAYINTAIEFMLQTGIEALKITAFEDHEKTSKFKENDSINIDSLNSLLSSILRNEFWCRLVSDKGFIHFGWDYYMYIGVSEVCETAIIKAKKQGLFVEEFTSPYHP